MNMWSYVSPRFRVNDFNSERAHFETKLTQGTGTYTAQFSEEERLQALQEVGCKLEDDYPLLRLERVVFLNVGVVLVAAVRYSDYLLTCKNLNAHYQYEFSEGVVHNVEAECLPESGSYARPLKLIVNLVDGAGDCLLVKREDVLGLAYSELIPANRFVLSSGSQKDFTDYAKKCVRESLGLEIQSPEVKHVVESKRNGMASIVVEARACDGTKFEDMTSILQKSKTFSVPGIEFYAVPGVEVPLFTCHYNVEEIEAFTMYNQVSDRFYKEPRQYFTSCTDNKWFAALTTAKSLEPYRLNVTRKGRVADEFDTLMQRIQASTKVNVTV